MNGFLRLTVSLAIVLVALLATALVFDVIPGEFFSEAVKKIVLVSAIAGLTAAALAFVVRIGK